MLSLEDQGKINNYLNNRVIVRIWTSKANPLILGQSLGHVSLEIPATEVYMSLWPFQGSYNAQGDTLVPSAKETKGPGIMTGIDSEDIASFTFKKDLRFEGRPPEVVLCFYTLDIPRIQGEYERFIRIGGGSGVQWGLLGFNGAESCASSVWKLLEAGKIRQLLTGPREALQSSTVGARAGGSFFSGFMKKAASQTPPQTRNLAMGSSLFTSEWLLSPIVKSPDMLAEYLQEAKRIELRTHPLTGNEQLIFQGEAHLTSSATHTQPNN